MTKEEFASEMRAVLVFYRSPVTPDEEDQQASYLRSVYDVVKDIPHSSFREVCRRVNISIHPARKPLPSAFIEAWRALGDHNRRTVSERTCDKCRGVGFVEAGPVTRLGIVYPTSVARCACN